MMFNSRITSKMAIATVFALTSASAFANQGIEADGTIYFNDQGWSGQWNFICLAQDCVAGSLVNGRWTRTVSGIEAGQTYSIQLKIQDDASGQYISPFYTVVAGETSAADAGVTDDVGAQQPDATTPADAGTPVDVGTPDTGSAPVDAATPDTGNTGNQTYGYDPELQVIWHIDPNTNAQEGFHYGCLNGNCVPATLNGDRYERSASGFGATVTAYWQIDGVQPNPTPSYTFEGPGGANNGNNGNNNNNNNNNGGMTGCTGLDCLDWTSNSLISGKDIGPAPRSNPPRSLATPMNGAQPTSHGFAFDIDGSQLSWRWGQQIIKGQGDSGLQMHCSQDGGATYTMVDVTGGTATIPCSGTYDYFFRYLHPTHSLNNNPAHQWIYTGPFTTAGARVDVNNYPSFVDGSANWMRFRHPVSQDGTTAAVLDAQHNNDRLGNLDRYLIWVEDSPGNVQLRLDVAGSVLRNESMRNTAGGPNGQQFFAVTQNPGFDNVYSYGQVIQFEVTAIAGATGAQTYNDFSYYTVGYGWGNYGDHRLNSAGRAGTSMILSDAGAYIELENNAIFTQPVTTLHSEQDIDDFIVGHHLFHGIDPNSLGSSNFGEVKIGEFACGDCHFRDGRGSELFEIPGKGLRLPPPIFGVGLLESIDNRSAGFGWNGDEPTINSQVETALVVDHGVQPGDLPGRVLELIQHYTKVITVPNRNPGSYDLPGVARGDVLFNEIGCADCHMPTQQTSSSNPAFDNLEIRPYTDMQTWNVNGGQFRTPPLWGLGHNIRLLEQNNRALLFMHDGSATSVDQAIQLHDADAANSRAAFNALSAEDRQNVINFVRTL